MYICLECGAVFEEPETWEEGRGEFWGFPCSETVSGCPECGGDYEDAVKCRRCEEWHSEDELTDELCECCQDELFD